MSSGTPERLLWFPAMAGRRVSAASEEEVSSGQAAPSDEDLLARVQKKDYDAVGTGSWHSGSYWLQEHYSPAASPPADSRKPLT